MVQKEDEQRERTVSGRGEGREDGERYREGGGGWGKKSCLQLHRGFVLFPACCRTEGHISQAIMIDSFGISEGTCASGERVCSHTCASVHSPVNVVRFVADPDVLCARLARDGRLGEERK